MDKQKSKFDLEMEAWENAFGDKKNLKIVLYGAGRITATLLSRQEGYNIIGICDRNEEAIGKSMYGLPIVNQSYVEENADILVINTSESYWHTIYQRVCTWDIPVYYRNGELAVENKRTDKTDIYWKSSFEKLEEQIRDTDFLSFDVFETLIMRRIIEASDVFRIVEKKLSIRLDREINFVELRKQAAANLDNPTFDEIYEELSKISGWDEETISYVKKCEWDVETELIVPRQSIISLFKTYRNSKKIFLISDMYFTASQICELLKNCGVEIAEKNVLVSCELRKTKAEGTLWKYYKEYIVKDKKALHIGDNLKDDVEKPKEYGIKSFYIRNRVDMLENSSIKTFVSHVNSLYSSVNIGTMSAKLCDDPFVWNTTCGDIIFKNLEIAGYSIWGNVVLCFFDWICENVKLMNIKQLVFFAREGYLLVPLFEKYLNKKGLDKDIKATYLDISRRAVMCASIQDRTDIEEIADFPYEGNISGFFKERFNINIFEPEYEMLLYSEVKNAQIFQLLLDKYQNDILLESKRERENYLRYINEKNIEENFTVVDSQIYGSTQFYLSKMLGKSVNGLYMCVALGDNNKYKNYNVMKGCFAGSHGEDGMKSSIYRYAPFTESFFTAPNGMFMYIDDIGKAVYSPKKKNQEYFDVRFKMAKGIELFIEDSLILEDKLQIEADKTDRMLADRLFETWMEGGFTPSDDMKKAFWYDNVLIGNKEVPIWE